MPVTLLSMPAEPLQPVSPGNSTDRIGTDRIGRLLLRFSVPAIIGMLVNALYNIVDRMFIGYGIGPQGIAGVTISFPLMMAMVSFSILVGVGANTLFAIRMGEGRREEAERILGNAFGLLFFVPLAASLAGLTENAVGPRLARTSLLAAYSDGDRVTRTGVERARYDLEEGRHKVVPPAPDQERPPLRFRARRPETR